MRIERLETRRLFSSGLFAPPQTYSAEAAAELVAAGDFDGDGTLDIVSVGVRRTADPPVDAFLYALLNDGAGRFADFVTPGLPGTYGVPARILAAHLNDDAFEDVAVYYDQPGFESFRFATYLSNGDGRFTQSEQALPVPVRVRSTLAAAADFDDEGRRELAVDNTILYRSGGAFAPLDTNAPVVGTPVDLNGDGRTDLYDAGDVRLNDGAGSLLPRARYAGGGFAGLPAGYGHGSGDPARPGDVGDFNGDGTLDTVQGNRTAGSPLAVNLYGAARTTFLNLFSSQTVPVAADVDGDGLDDLAVGSEDGVRLFVSRGDGTFRQAGTESAFGGAAGYDLTVADFNRDGRDDFAAIGGGIQVYLGGGGTAPAPAATFGATGGGTVPKVTVPVTGASGHESPAVTFALKGPGTGRVFDRGRGTGLALVLDGTTAASSLTITNPFETAHMLTGLQVSGSLRSVTANSTVVAGDFAVTGTLRSLNLLGTDYGARLTIAGAGVPTSINITSPIDLTLTTQSPVSRLTATRWLDKDALPDLVTAPSIGSILFRPSRIYSFMVECQADFNVTGVASGGGLSLRTFDVRGSLFRCVVRTAGSIGVVRAADAADSTVFAGVAGGVTELPASAAEFAAQASIGSVRINGPMAQYPSHGIRVAAWSIGSFQIGGVSSDASATPWGLAARAVRSYSRATSFGAFVRKSRLTTPGAFDAEQGYYVARIV